MDHLATNMRGVAAYHSWASFLIAILCPPLRGRWGGPAYSPRRIAYLQKHEHLDATTLLVTKTDPDILILNEVIPEIHGSRLDRTLKALGFTAITYGLGAKYTDAHVSTLVASKEEAVVIPAAMPQLPYPGCGGGIAGLRLKSGISVIGAHMAFVGTSVWQEQLASIQDLIKNEKASGNKVVFAGDCNAPEKPMTPSFSELGLTSVDGRRTPTCPTSLPRMLQKSLDHIYMPHTWKTKSFRTIPFGSDHMAIYVEALEEEAFPTEATPA